MNIKDAVAIAAIVQAFNENKSKIGAVYKFEYKGEFEGYARLLKRTHWTTFLDDTDKCWRRERWKVKWLDLSECPKMTLKEKIIQTNQANHQNIRNIEFRCRCNRMKGYTIKSPKPSPLRDRFLIRI